jgi:alpha-glucuronidase
MTEHGGHPSEDGCRLWLRYDPIKDPELHAAYRAIAVGTAGSTRAIESSAVTEELRQTGEEGFVIARRTIRGLPCTVIAANRDIGVMYGVFHLLRHMQRNADPSRIPTMSVPRIRLRILDHWDNLDGTVERGYAGKSLWDWRTLPDTLSPRYKNYAKANASIGINGVVLTNVNADPRVLPDEYLVKAAALARVFRPYGIRIYLTARFAAPVEIGGLSSADLLSPEVIGWWGKKARAWMFFC